MEDKTDLILAKFDKVYLMQKEIIIMLKDLHIAKLQKQIEQLTAEKQRYEDSK